MKRKQLSGSQKRELSEEKKQKNAELIQKLSELTSYFQTSSTENVPGSLDVSEANHSLGDESQKTEESEETAIISEDQKCFGDCRRSSNSE